MTCCHIILRILNKLTVDLVMLYVVIKRFSKVSILNFQLCGYFKGFIAKKHYTATENQRYYSFITLPNLSHFKNSFTIGLPLQTSELGDCRAVLVDRPSFLLLYVARTDLGMPMDTILVTIQGSER